jgi:hypothetical protein
MDGCREKRLINPTYRVESNSLPKLSHKPNQYGGTGRPFKICFEVRIGVSAIREGQKKNKLNRSN